MCGITQMSDGSQMGPEPGHLASRRVLTACGSVPTVVIGEEGPRFVLFGERSCLRPNRGSGQSDRVRQEQKSTSPVLMRPGWCFLIRRCSRL